MTGPRHLSETEVELQAVPGANEAPAHLAQCAQCSAAVARATARRTLLSALPEVELDPVAFRRVERELFAPRAAPRKWWAISPAYGLALAAAAVLLVRTQAVEPEATQCVAATPPAPSTPALPAFSLSMATPQFIQGTVEILGADGSWGPLGLEPRLVEGASIRTGEGRLAVSLEPGRGFVVEPNSKVELQRLRAGQTLLRLSSGAVYCALSPLRAEETFAVAAGPRWVRVVGTAFAVTRWPTRVAVEVEHGTVAVADDELGPAGVRVPGPGELEIPDGALLGLLTARALGPDQAGPLAARPAWRLAGGQTPPLALLSVTEPAGARVQVDELGWGPLPLFGRFPLGPHRVRARIDGDELDTTVVLKEGGAPTSLQLQRPARPVRSVQRPDQESEALAAEVTSRISARKQELRYCYEHWLKRNPGAAGRLVFKFRLSDDGAVASMDVQPAMGTAPPDETAHGCFAQAVEGLSFPAGTQSELEVPLEFKPAESP